VRAVPLYFFAGKKVGGRLQVSYSFFGFFESEWHKYLALGDETRAPKLARHLDFVKRDRFNGMTGGGKDQRREAKKR
jgi:hypothetical protein